MSKLGLLVPFFLIYVRHNGTDKPVEVRNEVKDIKDMLRRMT